MPDLKEYIVKKRVTRWYEIAVDATDEKEAMNIADDMDHISEWEMMDEDTQLEAREAK